MDKKIFSFIFLITLLLFQSAFSSCYSQCSPSAREYTIHTPAGITSSAILMQEINSNTTLTGQNISAVFVEDFKYKDNLIASSGSVLLGNIVSNKKAANGKNAQIQVRFTTIRTLYNNIIPISAMISEKDSTGILKGTADNGSILIPSNTKVKIVFDQPITLGAQ